jgi:hypothetical protein
VLPKLVQASQQLALELAARLLSLLVQPVLELRQELVLQPVLELQVPVLQVLLIEPVLQVQQE